MAVRRRVTIILFCAVWAFDIGLAQERPKIYLGATSKTLGYSPLWVAAKKGFFEQQGLDVQLVLLRGVPMTVQALAANSLHFGSGGPEPYIEASERGLDFIVIGGIINGIAQFLVAGKNYKTYDDLRGATFGTSSLTGGIVTAMREALKLKGLEYPRDYKLLIIAGGSSANLAALQAGQIAATTMAAPLNYAAQEAGFNILGKLKRRHPAFSDQCICRAPRLGGKESSDYGTLHESPCAGDRWLFENKDAAVEFLSQEMKLKPLHARLGWELYTQNRHWPPDGDVTMEGMKNNIRIYAELTGLKGPLPDPVKYVDRSYLPTP